MARDCADGVFGNVGDDAGDAAVDRLAVDKEVCEAVESVADSEEEDFGCVVGSGLDFVSVLAEIYVGRYMNKKTYSI